MSLRREFEEAGLILNIETEPGVAEQSKRRPDRSQSDR
jgi:hypothetical protein